jgi:hypothetical protein
MKHTEDIFEGYGVEVKLNDPENFLKIKETLTRMGVSSKNQNKLYQSCHILHKRGRYAILHFKELLALDGLESDADETDIGRRNVITALLAEWGLLDIIDKAKASEPIISIKQLKIISHKEKAQWELIPKYHVGKKKYQ